MMKFLLRSLKLQQRLICLALGVVLFVTSAMDKAEAAPAVEDEDADGGCYYMFNHYGEGDRIMTNEPCLNCTCHNSMLMCYLRVCPFTKPIGQDCIVEKRPDQCCPVITCPEVPVSLVTQGQQISSTSTTTVGSVSSASTAVALADRGCEMDGTFYPNGAQVISDPTKPCELCYCIRNRTACVMQECILHVEGCEPVFEPGVCCPVRYQCDIPPRIETTTTIAGLISTTLTSLFVTTTPQAGGCYRDGEFYADGSQIPTPGEAPCEHCYCMRGEIVCAVQECGSPMEGEGENCTAIPPRAGLCCPEKYQCQAGEVDATTLASVTTTMITTDEKVDVEPASVRPVGESQIEKGTTEAQELKPDEVTATSPSQFGSTLPPEGVTSAVTEAEPIEQFDDQATTQDPKISEKVKEVSLATSTEVVPEASTLHIGLATTLAGSSSTEAATTEKDATDSVLPEDGTTAVSVTEKEFAATEKVSTASPDVGVTSQDEGAPTTAGTTEITSVDRTTMRVDEPPQSDDVPAAEGPTTPAFIQSTTQREEGEKPTTEAAATEQVITEKQQVEVATATPSAEQIGIQSTTQEAISTSEQALADDKTGTEGPTGQDFTTVVNKDDFGTQTTPQYSTERPVYTEATTSQEGLSSTEKATSAAVQDVTYQPADVFGTSTVSSSQEPSTTIEPEAVTQQESETEKSSSAAPLATEVPTTQKEVTEAAVTGVPTTTSATLDDQTQKVDTIDDRVATEAPSTSEVPASQVHDEAEPTATPAFIEQPTTQVGEASTEQTTERESTETLVSKATTTTAPAELPGATAATTEGGVPQTTQAAEVPEGTQTSTQTSTDSVSQVSTTTETKYADDATTQGIVTESLVTSSPEVTTNKPVPGELGQDTTTEKLVEPSTVSAYQNYTEDRTTTVQSVDTETQRPTTPSVAVTEAGTTQREVVDDEQAVTQEGIQSTTVASQKDATSTPKVSSETEATETTELGSTSTVSSIEQLSSTVSEIKTTEADVLSDDAATATTSKAAGADEQIGQTTSASVFEDDKTTVSYEPVSTSTQSIATDKEVSTEEATTVVSSASTSASSESSLADQPPSSEISVFGSTEKGEDVTSVSTESAGTTSGQQVTEASTENLIEIGSTVSSVVTEAATATTAFEVTDRPASSLAPSSPLNLLLSSTTPSSATEISTISATEGELGTTIKVKVGEQDEAVTVTEASSPTTSRPAEGSQGTSTVAQTEFTTVVTEAVKPTEATGTSERPQDLPATSTEKEIVATSVAAGEDVTTVPESSELPHTTVESVTSSSTSEGTHAPLFDQEQPAEASTTEGAQIVTTLSSVENRTTTESDEEPGRTTFAPDAVTTKVQVTESTLQPVAEGASTTEPEISVSTSTERVDQTTVSEVQEAATATTKPLGDDYAPGSTSGPLPTTVESEIASTTEQVEITSTGFSRIPGEGSCFVEGVTYRNGSRIPPSSPCQIACACQNSIVHCLLVHCPPPPTRFGDCKPIYMPQTCCPKYDCDVASSSPGSIVTPVSEDKIDEDKVIVTPEPSVTQETSPQTVTDETVQSDDTSEGPSTTEVSVSSSTEKSIESTSTEVKTDATSQATPSVVETAIETTTAPQAQTVEGIEATPAPVGQTEATEATTARPASQTESVQATEAATTSQPLVDLVSTTVAAEFDNETTTTPLYPVTVSTTVTSSPASWPYPSQTTTPAGMSTGACLFDSRVYMSAQQILRDDPCDFCFCFRGDIICLQQSCPPPIPGCYEEPIPGFCCPRYECPVGNSTTGSQGLLPPSYYHNQVLNNMQPSSAPSIVSGSGPGCEVQGEYYEAGQKIKSASGPCLECRCGENGMMNCDPRECQPEPMLRKMIEAISS